MKTSTVIFTSMLVLFSLLPILVFAQTNQPPQSKPFGAGELTVARVLSNVRQAIGYHKVKGLRRGFVLEEAEAASGSDIRILWFGTSGEFKQESKPSDNRPSGFDGKFGWQVDRTGLPAPMPQRLREKLLIPAWVRSGWWLNDAAPLAFSILPAETSHCRRPK